MILAIPIGWKDEKYNINQAYVKYVAGAGYTPLLVAPENNLKEICKIADGLLLPGGIDLDPIYYRENNYGSFWCDPEKDLFERNLFWEFMIAGKPVFGICRGFQLIAREYIHHAGREPISKGAKTLIESRIFFEQHLECHEMTGGFHLFRNSPHHFVEGYVNTLFDNKEYERDTFSINSMHHQAVRLSLPIERLRKSPKISKHFRALAWTERGLTEEEEGVVCEAFRIDGWANAPIMGVQWHPEELKDYNLLHCFFGTAEKKLAGTAAG